MRRIFMVAGESSGDLLGAGLIRALRRRIPDLAVEGIAGPRMEAEGCRVLYPLDRLSVMGVGEVLRRYGELHRMRAGIIRALLQQPPDLFVGIDAPDFNIGLERALRGAGIRTVHYVGPAVWAWREYRLRGIRQAVDLMLTLFPFEEAYFRERGGIPVVCVGHPLADEIPVDIDRRAARLALGLDAEGPRVALLPGSRSNEWRFHLQPFLATARWCQERRPGLRFSMALVSAQAHDRFQAVLRRVAPELHVDAVVGCSREVLAAADAALVVSGTATLEALLLKCPMLVCYRMSWLSYLVARALVRVRHFALPNLLAAGLQFNGRRPAQSEQEPLVPEFLQAQVRPDLLGPALLELLDSETRRRSMEAAFTGIHQSLRRDASETAAAAVAQLLGL